jgi:hypothetical protein
MKIKLQRDIDAWFGGSEIIENKISPVQIVTIKKKTPLFKGEDEANAIEKIEINENGFSLVAQKDLYQVGEEVVYIQPDYSLSDIPLFESFVRPFGDPKKSKLGSNYRIRAVKFNLHTGDDEPVYSVGILMPYMEVVKFLDAGPDLRTLDLVERLGITKWEEPENNSGGGLNVKGGRSYPEGVYKTDETNANNLWGHLEKKVGYPVYLIGSQKIDGCLDENTLITTDVGKIKISELNGAHNILTHNFENNEDEFVKIKNLLIRENIDNWYKIILEDDTELIITDNHLIYLPELDCFRNVGQLNEGDIVLKK